MNRNLIRIMALALVFCMLTSVGVFAETAPPQTYTDALVLINADTGDILYGKNENAQMYPASTTKIMVALLVLENMELDQIVTATKSAVELLPPGHTNIGIKGGEQLSVRQLLYALMLESAGDAANVLGQRISGSVDAFVELMNRRALEIGMKNTNYMNTSGAHHERHYTTAADMAILAREAMKNEVFREIVKTEVYIIPPTEKYPEERRMANTNKLLIKSNPYYYKYATGMKTGFTNPAKLCLVSSAEKNGVKLICVALGAESVEGKDMRFVDSKNLFEYGFANYKSAQVVTKGTIVAQAPVKSAKGEKQVLLEAGEDLSKLLKADAELGMVEHTDTVTADVDKLIKNGIKKGDVLGKAEYFVDSVSVGEVPLVATKDYAFDPIKNVLNVIGAIFTSPFLYLPFVLVFIILVIIRQYNYNLRKKQRRAARRRMIEEENEKRRAEMKKRQSVDDFLRK